MVRRINRAAMRRRLGIIVDALAIAHSEIDRAMASDDGLLDFAARYNQSLDWIVCGDLRGMIRARCPDPPASRPALRLVHSVAE